MAEQKKYSLKELHELSELALRHSELVELARKCSPTKIAKETAAQGWSKGQIKAARFLAMIRRDCGTEAFESIVLTFSTEAPNIMGMPKEVL